MRKDYRPRADAEVLRARIVAFISKRSPLPVRPCVMAWHFRLKKGALNGHLKALTVQGLIKPWGYGRYVMGEEVRKAS